MPVTKPEVLDPHAPKTFRRATTVAWAIGMVAFVVAVAAFTSWGLSPHGFLAAIAPFFGALPLIAFAVLSFYQPCVIVADEALTVRNALSTYRIPYPAISEFLESRIVLLIVTHGGTKVPVTAYTSGSGRRLFGHAKALKSVIDAIEDKMHVPAKKTDAGELVVRTVRTENIVISVGTVVLAVAIIWAAVAVG
jgi:hypothetical protein